jgi:hypothetical protein
MSFYQQEQIDALQIVLEHLQSLPEVKRRSLGDLLLWQIKAPTMQHKQSLDV